MNPGRAMRSGPPGRAGFSRRAIFLMLAILAVTYVLLALRFSNRPPTGLLCHELAPSKTLPREESVQARLLVSGPLGGVWAATSLNDLRRHAGNTWRKVPFDLNHAGDPTVTAMVNFGSGLAVATRNDIYRWLPVEQRRREDPRASSDWDCLTRGERRFDGGRILGLLGAGRLLLAASPKGLHVLGARDWHFRSYPPEFPRLISAVSLHLVGKSILGLLSGTRSPKIFRFTKATGFTVLEIPGRSLAPSVPTFSFLSAGSLWILQQDQRLGYPPRPGTFLRCPLDRHGLIEGAYPVPLSSPSAILGAVKIPGGLAVGFLEDGIRLFRDGTWTDLPRSSAVERPFVPLTTDAKGRLWSRADWTKNERLLFLGSGLGLFTLGLLLAAVTLLRPAGSEFQVGNTIRRGGQKIWSPLVRSSAIGLPLLLWAIWSQLVLVLPPANLLTPYRDAFPCLSLLLLLLALMGWWAKRQVRRKGTTDLAQKSFPSAAAAYEARIAAGSQDPMDYASLARCYGELGIKLKDALLVLDEGTQLSRSPLVTRELQLVRGLIFLRLGQKFDAVAELGRAIEGFMTDLPPGHGSEKAAEGFMLLGEALQGTNDPSRAHQAWQRAIEVDPVGTVAERCRRHLAEG